MLMFIESCNSNIVHYLRTVFFFNKTKYFLLKCTVLIVFRRQGDAMLDSSGQGWRESMKVVSHCPRRFWRGRKGGRGTFLEPPPPFRCVYLCDSLENGPDTRYNYVCVRVILRPNCRNVICGRSPVILRRENDDKRPTLTAVQSFSVCFRARLAFRNKSTPPPVHCSYTHAHTHHVIHVFTLPCVCVCVCVHAREVRWTWPAPRDSRKHIATVTGKVNRHERRPTRRGRSPVTPAAGAFRAPGGGRRTRLERFQPPPRGRASVGNRFFPPSGTCDRTPAPVRASVPTSPAWRVRRSDFFPAHRTRQSVEPASPSQSGKPINVGPAT